MCQNTLTTKQMHVFCVSTPISVLAATVCVASYLDTNQVVSDEKRKKRKEKRYQEPDPSKQS